MKRRDYIVTDDAGLLGPADCTAYLLIENADCVYAGILQHYVAVIEGVRADLGKNSWQTLRRFSPEWKVSWMAACCAITRELTSTPCLHTPSAPLGY